MRTLLDRDIERAIDAADNDSPPVDLTEHARQALKVLLSIAEDTSADNRDRIAAARAIADLFAVWLAKD